MGTGMEAGEEITKRRAHYASAATVRFFSYQDRVPRGEIYSVYDDRAYGFQGLDQMLLIMDDIMDLAEYPKASFEHRSFGNGPYIFRKSAQDTGIRPSGRKHKGGKKELIVVKVYYRQYASIQGEVEAVSHGKQKKLYFRSALELIRLIHEMLDGGVVSGK